MTLPLCEVVTPVKVGSMGGPQFRYRTHPDFYGYRFYADGSVWSQMGKGCRRDRGIKTRGPWKQRKTRLGREGYVYIVLYKTNGDRVDIALHILLLTLFRGPRPPGMVGRHLDDDRNNNQVSNLRWGTQKQNVDDAKRNGLQLRGEKVGNSKLRSQDVITIRRDAKAGTSFAELGRR